MKPVQKCSVYAVYSIVNGNKKGNTNGIPTSRGSATVSQKAGLNDIGTKGIDKKTQAGILENSFCR